MTTEYSALQEHDSIDFMSKGYDCICEPLNLHEKGQKWFKSIYEYYITEEIKSTSSLVLGSVSWMAEYLSKHQKSVDVVDKSFNMIEKTRHYLKSRGISDVNFTNESWLGFPKQIAAFGVVFGDNSLSYLKFPDEWLKLSQCLSRRMNNSSLLFFRFLSPPTYNVERSIRKIVDSYSSCRRDTNFTALRAALLFSTWNAQTYQIDTEQALTLFEKQRDIFHPLIAKNRREGTNDLETIYKYKGAGAIYYAPPLSEALDILSKEFKIISIHYGPYVMSRHFPLVVAEKI